MNKQKKVVDKAKKEQKEMSDALGKWNDTYSHMLTHEGIVEYGKKSTRTGHEKYIEQFHGDKGRCIALRCCAYTLQLVDPF